MNAHGGLGGDSPKSPILGNMLIRRAATQADASLIAAHRKAMFAALDKSPEKALDTMSVSFEPWVVRVMGEGKYFGWVISDAGKPVASAGLLILDWPPDPLDPQGERRGYLLYVFVEPHHRKRGLAHDLVEMCLAEARHQGIQVIALHGSNAGRPLYESFGFRVSDEMVFVLPEG